MLTQTSRFVKLEMLPDSDSDSWDVVAAGEIEQDARFAEYIGVIRKGYPGPGQKFALPAGNGFGTCPRAMSEQVYIDASAVGNEMRFLGHNKADFNCAYETWIVRGELKWIISAIRYINPGERLTVKYPHFPPVKNKNT